MYTLTSVYVVDVLIFPQAWFVCVCVFVRAYVHACMRTCVRACLCVCVRARACVLEVTRKTLNEAL